MGYDHPDGPKDLMTKAIHGPEACNASAIPIHLANSVERAYSRHSNPTVQAFESQFLNLEGGAETIAMASGMAAVSQALLSLLKSGDRLVVHERIFYGVRMLLEDYLPEFGIEVVWIDMLDLDILTRKLKELTKAVYFETVSNPHVEVIDATAVSEIATAVGALVIVDNTLLTPCLFRPMEHGADLVIHSTSKYIGGHGDAIGGVVTARSVELGQEIRKARRIFGGILSPSNAYIMQRGLKTLPMRIDRHCNSAMKVAQFLEQHSKVAKVHYPGLLSARDHSTAASFLQGYGAIISIELPSDAAKERFARALRMCSIRYSFGEPSTVVLVQNWTPLVRISVGLESPEDIIDDLDNALAAT